MTFSDSCYSLVNLAGQVRHFSVEVGGVFTYADFFNMLPLDPGRKIQRAIARLIHEGVITKIKRGIYITKDADLWVLASRLCPRGYISTDNVLSRNGLIGTIPARRVFILSALPRKIYETPAGLVYSLQIKKELMFGFSSQEKGIQAADSEKAFLDLLYFYQRGVRFVADPYRGIDQGKLDEPKMWKYLKAYRDKKYTNFFRKVFSGID